ncbi:glutathione gamma-glutamylcysteinyltransferase 1-like [Nymphaea colorata]|nr:glutathione gamma-glutamylcysteinyltransferase 1-like [Nymphaea colorata]
MAMAGLYRRILPSPPAVEFASSEGKQLFSEALVNGTMEGFFKLISYFQTQSEPAYCGLASLAVVLNALGIDPGRKWKGPWRWFDESMFDCCEPLEKVKAEGITFGKVTCLARCAGAKVEAFRANQTSIDDFRKHVINCVSSEDCHLITSYHRGAFLQTGTGHFSPIGGYHPGKDMALILDVARFKYPPHWVPLPLLWEAMNTIDEATGHHRGFMLVSKLQRAPSLLYTLSCKHESWVGISTYLLDEVPRLLESEGINTVQKVLSVIFTFLPSNVGEFVKWIAEVRRQEEGAARLSDEEKGRLTIKEMVIKQIHETEMFACVQEWLSSESPCCRKALSILGCNNNLPQVAACVCCQGAELLTGWLGPANAFCCKESCVRSLNGEDSSTVISGKVVAGNSEQGVDVLVPTAQVKGQICCDSKQSDIIRTHPESSDVLTALLLALPPTTWIVLKENQVLKRISHLVSIENLPIILQEEVLHLRRQLLLLKRCKDNRLDEELGEPS